VNLVVKETSNLLYSKRDERLDFFNKIEFAAERIFLFRIICAEAILVKFPEIIVYECRLTVIFNITQPHYS